MKNHGPPRFDIRPNEWLSDPQISICRPATRGILIDLLCAMHSLDCGRLSGTREQLARTARCSLEEFEDALADMASCRAADVESQDGIVTVISRRLAWESRWRDRTKLRQRKSRGHKKVTGRPRAKRDRSEVSVFAGVPDGST